MKDLVIIGDPHSVQALRQMVTILCEQFTDARFICVGDCGFGIAKPNIETHFLDQIHKDLSKTDNLLYIIRGNHDDPSFFIGTKYWTSRINLLKDYSIIKVRDKRVLCVGGAVSIDRLDRIAQERKGKSWWPDEIFVYKDASNFGPIDMVVTHSAPNFCFPLGQNALVKQYIKKEAAIGLHYLEGQLLQERESHTQLYKDVSADNKISHWFYGHFHCNNVEIIDDTKFVCVDKNDFYHVSL